MFKNRSIYQTVLSDQMNYCILGYYDHIPEEEFDAEYISSILLGNEPITGYRATYNGRHLLEDCKLIRQIKAMSKLAVMEVGTSGGMFDHIKELADSNLRAYMETLVNRSQRVQFIRERLYCVKFYAEYISE